MKSPSTSPVRLSFRLIAGAAAMCIFPALAGSAAAGPASANRFSASAGGLLHLAQDSGAPRQLRRLPCDPNDPDCVLPKELRPGELRSRELRDGERKRKPLSDIQKQAPTQQAEEPDEKRRKRVDQGQPSQPEQEQAVEPKTQEAPARQQATQPAPEQLQQRRRAEEPRIERQRQPENRQAQQPQRQEQPRQRVERRDDFAALLRDNRPAGELTDAELRQRIAVFTLVLESGRAGPFERPVRAALNAYQGELERRITAATGRNVEGLNATREARNILRDDRPASRMNDNQLRERISQTRTVLALPGLDPRFENRLRGLLANDREELRSRVARAEQPQRRQQFNVQPGRQVDRRELRRDMLDARDKRRRQLSDPNYRIVIPNRPVQRRAPMATIPLAEAYDEQIVEQLMAPPAQPINRRYSLAEYRANPALRTLMPGIEVDTVKFGFNEDFLREKEIIKLDRIGEIIERIVAGNPNEVFLIEGHTDLVGSDGYNEDLSWRRAAAVRDALTEYFYIPARNLEIVGYGEQFPRIPTEFEEPENRRSTIRRITPILYGQR